jgi:hypothetical protein
VRRSIDADHPADILTKVANPSFSQSERRNLAVPIIIAVAVLAAAAALIFRFIPSRPTDLAITHTATWQAHTVFKSDSIVVGQDAAEDNLYVLTTLHIDNRLHIPVFLKDFTATLTTADGKVLPTSAIEKPDLPGLFEIFPALKPLSTTPLLRETTIAPQQSAEGMVILRFPATQDEWDHRQSAVLAVDFYHQDTQTIPIPKP